MRAESAEQAVIGCILYKAELYDKAAAILSPEMFDDELCGAAFAAMKKLAAQKKPIDYVGVVTIVGDGSKVELYQLTQTPSSPGAFESYVVTVLDAWRERKMRGQLTELAMGAETADELTAKLDGILREQREVVSRVSSSSEMSFMDATVKMLSNLSKPDTSLKTSWTEFNARVGGLQRGCLYIIAARPGQGKTDFSLHMAAQLALTAHVQYQSLEMTVEQVQHRIYSRVCKINSTAFRDKTLTDAQIEQLVTAGERFKGLKIHIDDDSALTIEGLALKIKQNKPDIVFVDYLGLIKTAGIKGKAAWEVTEMLTKSLKEIAKTTNTVMVVMVQMNRQTDRLKGDPTLSDLRGGGSIEADADCVMFMCPEKIERRLSGEDSVPTRVIIAKNRYGECGELHFSWMPQYHTYIPIDARYE